MKKIIRLTESELINVVKKIINENNETPKAPFGYESMDSFFGQSNITCGKLITFTSGKDSDYNFYKENKEYFKGSLKKYYKNKCKKDLDVPVVMDRGADQPTIKIF